jgi:hypothetical protein
LRSFALPASPRERSLSAVKRLHVIAIVLGSMAAPAVASAVDFGIVTLDHGNSKTVSIGGSGRTLRACNDADSASAVLVTIGANAPHYLASGLCAEDIGEQIKIQSLGSGAATVDYKATCDSASMD